jgi:hypothetical protein
MIFLVPPCVASCHHSDDALRQIKLAAISISHLQVTHVISTKEDVELNAKKVEQAIEKGLPVVSMDWLTQSIAQKAKQDESKFDLAAEAVPSFSINSHLAIRPFERSLVDLEDGSRPAEEAGQGLFASGLAA